MLTQQQPRAVEELANLWIGTEEKPLAWDSCREAVAGILPFRLAGGGSANLRKAVFVD